MRARQVHGKNNEEDDDDEDLDDYDDDGGGDLYIIGAVCLSQNSLFPSWAPKSV